MKHTKQSFLATFICGDLLQTETGLNKNLPPYKIAQIDKDGFVAQRVDNNLAFIAAVFDAEPFYKVDLNNNKL